MLTGLKPGDICGGTISTMVHIPSKPPYYRRVIHTLELLEFSAKYQGRSPVMRLNPPLIHLCNYKFSTVWKTLVDNFLSLCIKRVES